MRVRISVEADHLGDVEVDRNEPITYQHREIQQDALRDLLQRAIGQVYDAYRLSAGQQQARQDTEESTT
jgi:hypothetical protein